MSYSDSPASDTCTKDDAAASLFLHFFFSLQAAPFTTIIRAEQEIPGDSEGKERERRE
jgi:hypothetical protein